MACSNIDDLPSELLVEILSKLDVKDALKCRGVSRSWNKLFANGAAELVVRVSSIEFYSSDIFLIGLRKIFPKGHHINVGVGGRAPVRITPRDEEGMIRAVEELGSLSGQWLRSFSCTFCACGAGYTSGSCPKNIFLAF